MNCQQSKEIMDSYIGDELLVETNHEVLRHLENCPVCRRELAARRRLRTRLRAAVINAPERQLNPAFAAQLRANLYETAFHQKWWERSFKDSAFFNMRGLPAAALCLVVMTGLTGSWLKYRNSSARNIAAAENRVSSPIEPKIPINISQPLQSPITQAVQIAWREITSLAAGDHENCALEFKLEEKPITLDEASKKYGKFNKNLDKAVIEPLREAFPDDAGGGINLLSAHSCVFQGRRFSHIVMQRQNHVISVLVTDTDLPPEAGDKIVSRTIGDLQAASFRTKHYAVFIVSDLPESENTILAKTINPSVRRHIGKFEV